MLDFDVFPVQSVNVFSGTIDMEEMTEIVTTFYSLEGASKGIAMERGYQSV